MQVFDIRIKLALHVLRNVGFTFATPQRCPLTRLLICISPMGDRCIVALLLEIKSNLDQIFSHKIVKQSALKAQNN